MDRNFRLGSNKKRVLELLVMSATAGGTMSSSKQVYAWRALMRELKIEKEQQLRRAIKSLYESDLVDYSENEDGTITISVKKAGQLITKRKNLDHLEVARPKKWDGKWRIVLFDIPEKNKKAREALREKLRDLGFKEYQKSVFVHPYPCEDEIAFLREVFEIKKHVRLGTLDKIDDDLALRDHFDLPMEH